MQRTWPLLAHVVLEHMLEHNVNMEYVGWASYAHEVEAPAFSSNEATQISMDGTDSRDEIDFFMCERKVRYLIFVFSFTTKVNNAKCPKS